MQKIIEKIEESKIIVIVRGVQREKLIPLAEAMYAGGIRVIECTYDASEKTSDKETSQNIETLTKHFGDRMVIGAGTVITKNQVELTKEAGGRFIISPDTNPEVIKATKELGLVSIPGALTPTEARQASLAGADFVKLFPVDLFGPKYIKTLSAPLSNIRFLAVNGISAENMRDYLEAGAVGVGVGSGIVNKKLIEENKFEEITNLARKYTQNV